MTTESNKDLERYADWSAARPEIISRSTSWPVAMAFGITFLLWGLIASPVVIAAGGVALFVSLAGWIGEIRHEHE